MEFKVFTLNCWGIPFVSKDKNVRIRAIASSLATCDYDVVCLQEVWLNSDYELIRDKIEASFPYSHYFFSGVFGSGVCIFSKQLIINTNFHKWMVNGYVHKINHGDWFGGKGIGMVQILFKGIIINVYSAHLHAEYNRDNDEYFACRVVQAYDTAQFINISSSSGDVNILAGDLNCEPGDLTHKFMVELTALNDAFLDQKQETRVATNCDLQNSYTPKSLKDKNVPGPRIDYILYKSNEKINIKLLQYKLTLSDVVPGTNINYSDHEAIESTFLISKGDNSSTSGKSATFDLKNKEILMEGIKVMDEGMKNTAKHRIFYWIATFILLALITASYFYEANILTLIYIIRLFLHAAAVYTFVMATIWNQIEINTFYSMKLSMQTHLRRFENNKMNAD